MAEFNLYAPWAAIAISLFALFRSMRGDRAREIDDKFRSHDLKIEAVDDRVEAMEPRVLKIESELTHLPDKDVTHKLELALSNMKSEMAALRSDIKPLSAMAGRIQEAMIEKVIS